ncbi:MAG: ABC transporter ATP-binding protein [Oscillospiraceae bacterium]|nr:ABC transporter ATP-binding protein [Oscillospiraceae bacterium]
MSLLKLNNVVYRYEGGKKNVLKGVNVVFESSLIYTIIGKSGSGKSTLLSLIAALDVATKGQITYLGTDMRELDRDNYRARNIGVVFQSYNLINNYTAIENVVLSMNISGSDIKNKKQYAYELLETIGIDFETANRKVVKLSGGEQQRVGIARALSHNPDIVIADEPTGNLDSETEDEILAYFDILAHKENKCVIIATHSDKITNIGDKVYRINDGRLSEGKTKR